jgi:hypothetical protein
MKELSKSRLIQFSPFLVRLFFIILILLPILSKADNFKFKLKNASRTELTVFYQITKESGNSKVHSLFKMQSLEERIKELNLKLGDTVSFYGQNTQNETTPIIKRNYEELFNLSGKEILIPLVIAEKQSASFESLENLGLKIEHNKVLNFLLKVDTNNVNSLSMLEDNFKNIYPLGTFLFVDTKSNRLLIPPLEPSFWNQNETYLSIQDSIDELVNTSHQVEGGAQVAFFLANLFSSLKIEKNWEVNFKGKISLIRWKPTANANIYQIFNDASVLNFLKNCYAQIDDPDVEFQRYRLYFLSSYERIDNFEIYGKQFFDWENNSSISIAGSNQGFQLLGSNLGLVYTKDKTLTNYFSVQNAVMRTKVYDFTPQLFREFKSATRQKILEETMLKKAVIEKSIIAEYGDLLDYNPDPKVLSLAKLTKIDSSNTLTPILTTVKELSPFPYKVFTPDTSKRNISEKKEDIEAYNFKSKLFNSHLEEIGSLFKQLDLLTNDLEKLSIADKQSKFPTKTNFNSGANLSEIEVNTSLCMRN